MRVIFNCFRRANCAGRGVRASARQGNNRQFPGEITPCPTIADDHGRGRIKDVTAVFPERRKKLAGGAGERFSRPFEKQ